jgi:hypothetical protein
MLFLMQFYHRHELVFGVYWGSGPAHVRVSGPLCELEGLLVNTASTRGSEENSH